MQFLFRGALDEAIWGWLVRGLLMAAFFGVWAWLTSQPSVEIALIALWAGVGLVALLAVLKWAFRRDRNSGEKAIQQEIVEYSDHNYGCLRVHNNTGPDDFRAMAQFVGESEPAARHKTPWALRWRTQGAPYQRIGKDACERLNIA